MTLAPPAPLTVLGLTDPLPGFPAHRDYVLVAADGDGRVFWLQSIDPEGPRFLTVPAAAYFADYRPALPASVRAALGLADPADAELYCLVSIPGDDVASATANLRAPLVVNPANSRAAQVLLADPAHPIRRPLRS